MSKTEKKYELAKKGVSEKIEFENMHNYTQICQQFDKEFKCVKFFTISN